jgi:hypothetical protein
MRIIAGGLTVDSLFHEGEDAIARNIAMPVKLISKS